MKEPRSIRRRLRLTCTHIVPILYATAVIGGVHLEIRGAEQLSFRERQVVVLKESGSPAAAIAARLGITEATVATLYRRARAKGYQVVIILDAGVLGLEPLDQADEPETEE